MKRPITAIIAALALGCTAALGAQPADWSEVDSVEIDVFYTGVAPMEWMLGDVRIDRARHGGGRAFRQGDTCGECHADETRQMGELIASGEKLESNPVAGRPGAIPVSIQAAHDGENLYLRFVWKQPPAYDTTAMDEANAVKLAFMLDAGKVDMADRSGCWASCHGDSRTMPDGDDARTKYVKDGSLSAGIYYDLAQWRSGENRAYEGYVAERRVLEPASGLNADGSLDGDTWSVVFTRSLSGGDGDVALETGQAYNFGFAIHNAHSAGRFHHVSLGYRLGIDVEADVTVKRF
jgi:hypothetical protein